MNINSDALVLSCYCGSFKNFVDCCHLFLDKIKTPETPEELMRSRYSAFVTKNYDYLLATHDPKTKAEFDLAGNKQWADSVQFIKLEVLKTKEYGAKATVEFKAQYQTKGIVQVHHELSTFNRIAGQWFYSIGKHLT